MAEAERLGGTGADGEELSPEEMERLRREGPVEVPIEGFAPERGEVDPGPGDEFIERYEGRSGLLSPSAMPHGSDVTTRMRSHGAAPTVVAWVPTIRVQAGGTALICVDVVDEHGEPVDADSVTVEIASREAPDRVTRAALTVAPEGADHRYEYAFAAPVSPPASEPGGPAAFEYMVHATGTFLDEPYERVVTGGFWVHSPGGSILPDSIRVVRDGPDIAVRFLVDIRSAGRFWAFGELWAPGDTPVAFGSDNFGELAPGRHQLSFRFGGEVIRSVGADGPYSIRNVRFSQVDGVPPMDNDPIAELPPTPPWHADEFGDPP